MFAVVLYDEMKHKTLMITFTFLAPDDPQMLYLCCITHKDLFSALSALNAPDDTSTLDGFVESERAALDVWWWAVKCLPPGGTACTASSSSSHKRPCIFMTATPNPNNKRWRGQAGKSAELFISPPVPVETLNYSPRQTHNKQGGRFTEKHVMA